MNTYDKSNPFSAKLVARDCLCSNDSSRKVYHLVLDLSNSNIQYKVGDSLAVFAKNHPEKVNAVLQALKLSGAEKVLDRQQKVWDIRTFLQTQANLSKISKKLFSFIVEKNDSLLPLKDLLEPSKKELFDHFLTQYEVWDFIEEYSTIPFDIQEFALLLFPLLPRFYSIASSMKYVGDQAHLTVALAEYETARKQRKGVCSQFLCEIASLNEDIPVYLQSSEDFTLPQDSLEKPIIMVGPGTGIAPFRGFMQERIMYSFPSKNWLFFGERYEKHNFFYEDFWKGLTQKGLLKMDLAFSRDQQEKVYVQHKMKEKSKELWNWLEEGSYFFVCGDASKMAKDVEQTLLEIIQKEGKKDPIEAKSYLKELKTQRRYLRDIY